jgi:hypothetical protein
VALLVSIGTAWFNIFHRGTIKMARPHFFALLPEDSLFGGWLKFFIRTLVFSTGKRGRVIETIYLDLKHDGKTFPFYYWMYGETDNLKIGSGIFVGPEGISANFHFVPTSPLSINDLSPGKYELSIRATLLGNKRSIDLGNISFELGAEEVSIFGKNKNKAIYYVWDIKTKKYRSRIDTRQPKSRSSSVMGSGNGLFSLDLG